MNTGRPDDWQYLPDADRAQHRGTGTGSSGGLLLALGRGGGRLTKHAPETQGLIGTSRDDRGAVRGLRHVQHTRGVAVQLAHLGQGGVLPEDQLVLGVPVAGQDLALVAAPLQRAHLGAGVNGVELGAGEGVPESDVAVSRTAPTGEQVALEGAPGQCLDGSLVRGDAVLQLVVGIPDAEQVVVAAAGELLARGRPLEAADLLVVRLERGDEGLVLALAHVPVADHAVAAAAGEHGAVPGERTDAVGVAAQLTDLLGAAGVPDLDLGVRSADGQVGAVGCPRQAGDVVALVLASAELLNATGACVPQVHGRAKGHRNLFVGCAGKRRRGIVCGQRGD